MANKEFLARDVDTEKIRTVILGGGRGERLFPLTRNRAKPAVAVGGKYRLIDITLSNCINSDLLNIFILTQFNSDSLHRHIATVYRFDHFSRGSVQVLAAQQTADNTDWFQGTADAVRKTLKRIIDTNPPHVLILSGDHLYRMDYRNLIATHIGCGNDITLSTIPVPREECSEFGILRIDENGNIVEFVEKPKEDSLLADLEVSKTLFESQGIEPGTRKHIASMGIYVFRTEVLVDMLNDASRADFGKEILPSALGKYRMGASLFDGYWQDIGTIRSFYEANIALTDPQPAFNFFDERHPMFTHPRFLPGAKVNGATVRSSIICSGAIIDDAEISNSVIGVRSVVREGCRIRRSVVMGADSYEGPSEMTNNTVPVGIGEGCVVQNAIIDKDARIGADAKIVNERGVMHEDGPYYHIREGITLIPRRATVPAGAVI